MPITCGRCNDSLSSTWNMAVVSDDDIGRDDSACVVCTYCLSTLRRGCAECGRIVSAHRVTPDLGLCSACERARHIWCDRCHQHTVEAAGDLCSRCRRFAPLESHEATAYFSTTHRRFGLEFEFLTPHDPDCTRWPAVLKGDGSISGDHSGYEIAIGPFDGPEMYVRLAMLQKAFVGCGAYANESCGLHVHLDMEDCSEIERKRVARWWAVFEDVWLATVDNSRRENDYCRSVWDEGDGSRYRTLNTGPAYDKWGTYEVRLHHGTTDTKVAREWLVLMDAFFATFQHIPAGMERKRIRALPLRDKLRFLFNACSLPLSLRKAIVRRVHFYAGKASLGRAA